MHHNVIQIDDCWFKSELTAVDDATFAKGSWFDLQEFNEEVQWDHRNIRDPFGCGSCWILIVTAQQCAKRKLAQLPELRYLLRQGFTHNCCSCTKLRWYTTWPNTSMNFVEGTFRPNFDKVKIYARAMRQDYLSKTIEKWSGVCTFSTICPTINSNIEQPKRSVW